MAKTAPASGEAQAVTEVPVDELRPIGLELIPQLRFTDNLGHIYKLEERWHQHGVFDLSQVIHTAPPKEVKSDEPG